MKWSRPRSCLLTMEKVERGEWSAMTMLIMEIHVYTALYCFPIPCMAIFDVNTVHVCDDSGCNHKAQSRRLVVVLPFRVWRDET